MSKFAEELNRRIQSGEPVHVTRKWYLECLSGDHIYYNELSKEEQEFMDRTFAAFLMWQEEKKLH
jgi:hypothetical protein